MATKARDASSPSVGCHMSTAARADARPMRKGERIDSAYTGVERKLALPRERVMIWEDGGE